MKINTALVAMAAALLVAACGETPTYAPKPTTYYRITLPQKSYRTYDTAALGVSFEYPTCANVVMKKDLPSVKWIDIVYPDYNGVIFLSYKKLKNPASLAMEVDTAYQLLKLHFQKSSGVEEQAYNNAESQVFANTWRLKGQQVASTFQFWATDSNKHFVRGAMYINNTPNYDSLEPVINYMQDDARHILETLKWK